MEFVNKAFRYFFGKKSESQKEDTSVPEANNASKTTSININKTVNDNPPSNDYVSSQGNTDDYAENESTSLDKTVNEVKTETTANIEATYINHEDIKETSQTNTSEIGNVMEQQQEFYTSNPDPTQPRESEIRHQTLQNFYPRNNPDNLLEPEYSFQSGRDPSQYYRRSYRAQPSRYSAENAKEINMNENQDNESSQTFLLNQDTRGRGWRGSRGITRGTSFNNRVAYAEGGTGYRGLPIVPLSEETKDAILNDLRQFQERNPLAETLPRSIFGKKRYNRFTNPMEAAQTTANNPNLYN